MVYGHIFLNEELRSGEQLVQRCKERVAEEEVQREAKQEALRKREGTRQASWKVRLIGFFETRLGIGRHGRSILFYMCYWFLYFIKLSFSEFAPHSEIVEWSVCTVGNACQCLWRLWWQLVVEKYHPNIVTFFLLVILFVSFYFLQFMRRTPH